MQFTNIIATILLAVTAVSALPPGQTPGSFDIDAKVNTVAADVSANVAAESSLFATRGEVDQKKNCIGRACSCNFASGARCAWLTNQYGLCNCPTENPDNASDVRVSTKCFALWSYPGRHHC